VRENIPKTNSPSVPVREVRRPLCDCRDYSCRASQVQIAALLRCPPGQFAATSRPWAKEQLEPTKKAKGQDEKSERIGRKKAKG
jgi:hypothetical protein